MKEPKLRFKEGNGMQFPDWEEKKIGELGTFTKGAPLSKADISDCGVPLILYGELYTTYNEVAYDIKRRTQSEVDKKYYSLVGDVVIPTSGETAEEISTATCVMAQNVILAGDLNIYRSDIVDGRIMSYILNHQAKWKIATLAQGKSVVHIQAAQISGVAVKYPPSIVEQQKIASLFTELDALIQSAEKELEGYKELKQGMLQKMFPKQGELVPEIRFPEFTGDWEQCKLGDVTEFIRNGLNYKSDGDRNYRYKIARIESISTGKINIEKLGSSETINKSYKLREGDILFSHINSLPYIANTAIYNAKFGEIYHGMNLLNIRVNQAIVFPYFLIHLLKRETSRRYFKIVAKQAVNQASISITDVEMFGFLIPTLEEQKKIGEYFSNLDNLIALQQKEIDGYKELKKGLLQQMFC